jgi:hypothetical protein
LVQRWIAQNQIIKDVCAPFDPCSPTSTLTGEPWLIAGALLLAGSALVIAANWRRRRHARCQPPDVLGSSAL